MNKIGNQEMVRLTNQRLILNLIREKKSISRAEIAKILNLSPPSTSSNINQLIDKGLIIETGEGRSIGGRRPILLELNREYGYMIGIDMGSREIKIFLGNLNAEILDIEQVKVSGEVTAVELLIGIINSINLLLKKNSISRDRILLMVAAVPGAFDETSNRIIGPFMYCDLSDTNFLGALEMEFKTKVIFKSYFGACAYGEYLSGINQKSNNLLYLWADSSLGAGTIINGELYEGSGRGGFIGRTVFSKEQITSIYRDSGYLEVTASTSRLLQRIRNRCKNDDKFLELCGGDIKNIDFSTLKRALEKNHLIVKDELDKVAEMIAIAAANINSIFSFDTIILGGEMASLGEYYILTVKRIINEVCLNTPYIMYSSLKDNAVAFGMMALGQRYIFEQI